MMPTPAAPPADALSAFEAAMSALQHHEYGNAAHAFGSLIDRFPAERGLLDRARVYVQLCNRELRRSPAGLTSVEDRLTAATAALNNGDTSRAESFASSALRDAPHHELALYLLASVEARRGESTRALEYLELALKANPEMLVQARYEADFESLRSLETFRALLESANPASLRSRQARSGR
jgi:tetratricopeptide (TPR) repeat protein